MRLRFAIVVVAFIHFLPLKASAQQAVGSIPGSFQVSLSGSATYTIPIRVAPGTAGVAPQLSLAYDSQALSGPLGAGWAISGLSAITRGPKDARFDGTPDGVRLQETDALYLDGQRLVAISTAGAGSGRVIEYRKAVDDQTRVVETGADFGSATFIVNTKGGLTLEFDSVGAAPPDKNRGDIRFSDGSVLLRAESRVSDSSGNYIDFYYLVNGNGDYDIKSIRYTGHSTPPIQQPYASIDFNYEAAPRVFQTFIAGRTLLLSNRLTNIVSSVAATPNDPQNSTWSQVARYTFKYENRDTSNRFVLREVDQFGEDDSELTPTQFVYSQPQLGWGDAAYSFPAILATHEELAAGYRFVHINSLNSLPDLLYSAELSGQLETFTFQNNGTSWTSLDAFKSPVPFVGSDGSDLGVLLADVTGDGRTDLLQSYSINNAPTTSASYVAGANGWELSKGFQLPFVVAKDGKRIAQVDLAKWSGGTGPDLLYQSGTDTGFLRNGPTGWTPDSRYKPPFDLQNPHWVIDVDCSGTPVLMGSIKDGAGSYAWKAYKFGAASWEEVTSTAFQFPFPAQTDPNAIQIISLDKTPCTGLLVASAQGSGIHAAYQASPTGWQPIPGKAPPFDLVDGAGQSVGAIAAPLLGDGLTDFVANKVYSDGHIVKFAFMQTSTSWQDVSQTFDSPVLAPPTSSATLNHLFVGDLTGNGRSDLLFSENSRNTFGRLYLATDSGFVEKPDLSPPVAFAKQGIQDQGVRALDLNGHGLADVLVSRAGDPTPSAWFNTGAGWKPEPGLLPPVPFAGTDVSGNPVQFLDVDGDGFVDMVYSYRDKTGVVATKCFRNVPSDDGMRKWSDVSTDNGGFAGLVPPTLYPFAAANVGDMGVRFADLAGTGRPYMLVGFLPAGSTTNPVLMAFRDDGHSWVAAPEYAPPVPFSAQIGPPNAASPDLTDGSHDLSVQIVDVNADGLPDIIAKYHDPKNPSSIIEGVWLNTGHGWSRSPIFNIPVNLDTLTWNQQTQALQWDTNASIQWADINGDGLPDIIYTRREGINNESTTYLGTGSGWVPSAAWQIPVNAVPSRAGDPGLRILDVNGDGYPDLVYARQESDGSVSSGLFINNGATWVAEDSKDVPAIPFVDKDGNDLGVRLLDLEGSGLLDLVQAYSGSSTLSAIKVNRATRSDVINQISIGLGMQTDIYYQSTMSIVAPDLGISTVTLPGIFGWQQVYRKDSVATVYPTVSPVPAAYVVRRTVLSEASDRRVAFSYRYGGLRMDALSKSGLGFAWRETVNEINGTFNHLDLSQDVDYVGKELKESTCWLDVKSAPPGTETAPDPCSGGNSWIKKLTSGTSEWKVEKAQIGGNTLPQLTLRQVSLTKTTSTTYELDGNIASSQSAHFEYDEPQEGQTLLDRHLNSQSVLTTWGDGYSVLTKNSFSDDVNHWFLGRLSQSTIVKTSPQTNANALVPPPETRTVGFSYDPGTGLLKSQTVNSGTSREVSTVYTRDSFGNVIQEQLHASNIPDHAPTSYGYDQIGRFLVSTTNALQQTSTQVLSVTSGLPERATDMNGLTVTYKYDGFGRTLQTTSPTSSAAAVSVITEYLPIAALDPNVPTSGVPAVYAERIHVTDGTKTLPYSVKLLDVAGRTVRMITEGFHSDYKTHRFIIRDSVYDILGQPLKSSVPYEAGGTPPSWNSVQRDVLGRVTQHAAADGGTIDISYTSSSAGGVKTTTVDHRRRRAVTNAVARNMRGLPILATDTGGKTLRIEYNAGEKPTKVTDPLGFATTYTYDSFGNRIGVSDPDAGKWTYEFDALGRLTRQIDSDTTKTLVTRIDYDALNRVKQETKAEALWTWEYDTADHGIGKLALIRNDAGTYTERFAYDEIGRLDEVAVSTQGKTYTSTKGYDSFGRISHIGYPNNFSINNTYDDAGYLKSVDDGSSGLHYWTLGATDTFGNITNGSYGNGVNDSDLFDPNTNRPLHLQATGSSGNKLVDLTLTYDIAGDLRRRADTVQKKTEQFDYDDLDRLTSISRPGMPNDIFTYDDGGRILGKTGTTFTYANGAVNQAGTCNSTPLPAHGVVATTNALERVSYTYDCHGNMTSRGDDLYFYNSDGKLFRVEQRSGPGLPESISNHFDYTPSGVRYREVAKHGARQIQTISVNGYEEITEYGTGGLAGKPCFVRYRWTLKNLSGPFAVVEKSHQQCNGLAGTIFHQGAQNVSSVPFDIMKTWYLHKDQLGSVLAITDETGKLRAQYWYDPWGKRSSHIFDDSGIPSGARLEDSWVRGFTGQEHLEDFELIHMNGRVYDPRIGVFTSPDPVNDSPDDTQLYDPYSYGRNNPFRYTDPSGNCFLGCFWQAPGKAVAWAANGVAQGFKAVGNAFADAGKWVGQNWRQVVIVAAVVAVTVVTAGTGGPAAASLGTAILSGMAAGATAGGLSAALYGGSLDDVLVGAFKGAAIGAVSGAAFYGVGSLTAGGGTLNGAEGIAGHGIIGGAREAAFGGNFWHGFEAGALTKTSSLLLPSFDSGTLNVARAAVVGGGVAAIGGGNFANGAVTGAFSYAFNDAMHPPQEDAIYSTAGPEVLVGAAFMTGAAAFYEAGAALYEAGSAMLAEFFTDSVAVETDVLTEGLVEDTQAPSSFFEGTQYTPKVIEQMQNEADTWHSFPELISTQESAGQVSTFTGSADGVPRQVLEIPGSINGREGVYRFIKESNGDINEHLFVPK